MKAALVVHQVVPGVEANLAAMAERIAEAAAAGARLVLFPEAALTGLIHNDDPSHDLPLGQPIPGPATGRLGDLARRHAVYVAAGLLERDCDALYDSAVLLGPDGLLSIHYRRIQPHWHGRDADPRVYRQGDRIEVAETPFGRVAFLICGDLFDDTIVARLRDARPDLLLLPFARNFGDGSFDQARWDREEEPAYAARAALAGCLTLMVNALEDPALTAWPAFGGAMVVSSRGEVLARHPLGRPGVLYFPLR
jgi:N-carbamoylputrescine amidase